MRFEWPNWLKSADRTPLRVGIDGLPEAAGLLSASGLHFVSAGDGQARRRLLTGTALGAAKAGCRAIIISDDPDACLDDLQTLEQSASYLANGSLQLFRQLPEASERLGVFGCSRFLQELEDTGVGRGDLILLDGADAFFDWSDADQAGRQAETYRRWFAEWRIVGLFLFGKQSIENLCGVLGAVSEGIAGVAELSRDLDHYQWRVKHWTSGGGVLRDKEYDVYGEGRKLSAAGPSQTGEQRDGDSVYCTANGMGADETLPENWVICGDYSGLTAQAEKAVAASFVVHYRQQQDFLPLAKTVHKLRFSAGRDIKIIVRERGIRLRYSQELLLAKLGANRVVYREFSLGRLLWTIESLKGQRYIGQIEEDFDASLAAAIPSEVCGYLPPARFCEVVKETLHKTETMGMHHVLVRLDILPEKAHLDVLLSCRPKRANDIVTADQDHLYLFLFACHEQDVDAALARIVAEPLELLFSGQSYWAGRAGMLEVVNALALRAKAGRLADFSAMLPDETGQPIPVAKEEAPENHRKRWQAPPAKARPAAGRTVVRHALALRG